MPKEVKFTEEELKQVQEVDLELNVKKIQDEEQKFLEGITEKYGEGTLSPETGVFTPNKSE